MGFWQRTRRQFRVSAGWLSFAVGLRPTHKFADQRPPAQADYATPEAWAALPEAPGKTAFTPQGIAPRTHDRAADCFFIHPTSYFGKRSWNAPLSHPHANELVDEMMMASQASVFNGACRIYAPRYRQATFYTFLQRTHSGRAALELAYSDVLRAFDHYIAEHNDDRPFFIGSHSQGTVHAMRLLKERIEGTALASRMVAAYTIGFRFPLEKFDNGYFKALRPSRGATDTGCVVAWDTYDESSRPAHFVDRAEIWYGDGEGGGQWVRRAYKTPVATNPLSWTSDERTVPAEQNAGAVHILLAEPERVHWKGFGGEEPIGLHTIGLSHPHRGECSATLKDDGFLYISWPKTKAFTQALMPGGNFHNYDYDLFHMNMRQNIEQRLDAYLAA